MGNGHQQAPGTHSFQAACSVTSVQASCKARVWTRVKSGVLNPPAVVRILSSNHLVHLRSLRGLKPSKLG